VRWFALLTALALAALFGSAELAAVRSGKVAMDESRAALALGRVRDATVLARRAAEAAVPGSPYAAEGFVMLGSIARAAEVSGRNEEAAFAFRAMRSAAVAVRPSRVADGRIEEAEAGMLRIAASPLASRSGAVPAAPENILRSELAVSGPPSPWLPSLLGWLLLGVGVLAWRKSASVHSDLPGSRTPFPEHSSL
jgi:hypothetical protein